MEPTSNEALVDALRRSEKKFRYLIEKSNLLIFVFDESCNVTYAYEDVANILHFPSSELLGKPFCKLVLEENRKLIDQALDRVRIDGSSTLLENLSIRDREGNRLFFDGTVTNLTKEPIISGYVLYLCNVSRRTASEEHLKKLNYELDNFVYRISHDLRAPIATALGLINLVPLDTQRSCQEYMKMIEKTLSKLEFTIKDLTEYFKNERHEAATDLVEVEPFLQEIFQSLSHLENWPRISFSFLSEVKHIYTDAFRLRIILNNLVSNAVKFADLTKEIQKIEVSLTQNNEWLVFTISDNGIGIGEDIQQKVFDIFFRGNAISDGAGLGLYIANKVVDKLNGTIHMTSSTGEGSIFKVSLPSQHKH